jgi:hypothetical protein
VTDFQVRIIEQDLGIAHARISKISICLGFDFDARVYQTISNHCVLPTWRDLSGTSRGGRNVQSRGRYRLCHKTTGHKSARLRWGVRGIPAITRGAVLQCCVEGLCPRRSNLWNSRHCQDCFSVLFKVSNRQALQKISRPSTAGPGSPKKAVVTLDRPELVSSTR